MDQFMLIYLIILGTSLIVATGIVIGMKWLYEKRNKRNK